MEGQDEARRLGAVSSDGMRDEDPSWVRLDDQLDWYDRKSPAAQQAYKCTKVVQLVLAAGVPVAVAVGAPGAVTASLGAVVVVLEGVQQLFQWQTNPNELGAVPLHP